MMILCLLPGHVSADCPSAQMTLLSDCIETGIESCVSANPACTALSAAMTVNDVVAAARRSCCRAHGKAKRKSCIRTFSSHIDRIQPAFYNAAKKKLNALAQSNCKSGTSAAVTDSAACGASQMSTCVDGTVNLCQQRYPQCRIAAAVLSITGVLNGQVEACCTKRKIRNKRYRGCLQKQLSRYNHVPRGFFRALKSRVNQVKKAKCRTAPTSTPTPTPTSLPEQKARLRIVNSCSYDIWIESEQNGTVTGEVKLAKGQYHDYDIPEAGAPATRYMPKKGCDETGNNCEINQVYMPCLNNSCQPNFGSKFEVTWGCLLADSSSCAINPVDGKHLSPTTYYDSSAVDGYNFGFKVEVLGGENVSQNCLNIDCSAFSIANCPTNEDLSVGRYGTTTPQYSSMDLRVTSPATGQIVGCYSSCGVLTGGLAWKNGQALTSISNPAFMYCCPGDNKAECENGGAGPVLSSKFTEAVHHMCNRRVYTWAYDDINGLFTCDGTRKLLATFGPNCP